jgi:hypothetical protein
VILGRMSVAATSARPSSWFLPVGLAGLSVAEAGFEPATQRL